MENKNETKAMKVSVRFSDLGVGIKGIYPNPKCKELIRVVYHPKFCGYCGQKNKMGC